MNHFIPHHVWPEGAPVSLTHLMKLIDADQDEPLESLKFPQNVLSKRGVKRLWMSQEHWVSDIVQVCYVAGEVSILLTSAASL